MALKIYIFFFIENSLEDHFLTYKKVYRLPAKGSQQGPLSKCGSGIAGMILYLTILYISTILFSNNNHEHNENYILCQQSEIIANQKTKLLIATTKQLTALSYVNRKVYPVRDKK